MKNNDKNLEEGLIRVQILYQQNIRELKLEIADQPEERRIGLMNRDILSQGQGMLFIFDDEQERSFWMKNTKIKLDMIFFDAEKKYVNIVRRAVPCLEREDCPSYYSNGKAKYVIETNAGELKDNEIGNGAYFKILEK